MKKLAIMMCLCAVAVCASAQKVTIWYGANLAKVSDGPDSEMKFLNIGATYTAPISDAFDWSAGLAYVTKGCKEWDPSTLQVDLDAHWNFVAEEDVKVGLLAGPYVGYVINDDDAEAKSLDYGLSAGVQASYKQFSLRVGYEFGLSKVIDGFDGKNRDIYFRIGYSF